MRDSLDGLLHAQPLIRMLLDPKHRLAEPRPRQRNPRIPKHPNVQSRKNSLPLPIPNNPSPPRDEPREHK